MNAESGEPAGATQTAVSNLKNGYKVNGVIVAVTPSDCRIFKPASAKGAHKTWDEFMCDSAAVVKTEGFGYSLVGLFGDGKARAYSIPGLKEIGSATISQTLEMRRLGDAAISPTGNILGWVGPSEVAMLNVWGSGLQLYYTFLFLSPSYFDPLVWATDFVLRHPSEDQLFNVNAVVPPRPTISNFQWISGTQFISPADMDILSKHYPIPDPTSY